MRQRQTLVKSARSKTEEQCNKSYNNKSFETDILKQYI